MDARKQSDNLKLDVRDGVAPALLDFELPNFVRTAWVSEDVRAARGDKLRRISRAWDALEWRTVVEGVRRCALRHVYLKDYVKLRSLVRTAGLDLAPMRIEEVVTLGDPRSETIIRAAIGRKRDLKLFKEAWIEGGPDDQGSLLGYPACCRAYFHRCFVGQGFSDPTWLIARNTTSLPAAGNTLSIDASPELNILLRCVNVRAVPHLPCRFDCGPSLKFARQFLDLAHRIGYAEEADGLCEMLAWPAEFSMLHGIAEIRTPVMKIVTQTDATGAKYAIRWIGRAYPLDGARGLSFPYNGSRPAKGRASKSDAAA
jgi:hypothetical protein